MTMITGQDGRDVTAETVLNVRKVIDGTGVGADGNVDQLRKATGTVTTSTGLVAYDLEAPSKTLYPILTPIRNKIPRETTGIGLASNWRQVDSISGNSSLGALPWVPEGQRAARMSITTSNKSATYVTIGLEADVTFEAQSAARTFEDELSATGARLLQQTMVLEEYAIVGGNASVLLGTPVTPTLSAAGSGATLPAATYSVYVFGLTFEGYLMATVAGGIKRSATITGMDGNTYSLNGGSSKTSAQATQAVTLGQTLSMYTTAITGAVAYAWYVGTAGNEKLEAITTINSYAITAPLAATGQAYSAIADGSTDRSLNTTAFDGLLTTVYNNTSTAYFNKLATGTPGTGTTLTASGRGTVTEIDTALQSFWSNYRLSPDEIYVNAQELKNIYNKCFANGSNPLVRFMVDANNQTPTFVAGQILGFYVNPYSLAGGQVIPIRLHPFLPPGTILFWCQNLPAYYQSSQVPQVCQIQCRRDYYQIPWPIVTRSNATGVYAEEVLKVYAPFALGVITNIANG